MLGFIASAFAHEGHAGHEGHEMPMNTEPKKVNVELPVVSMIRQDGKKVDFPAEVADGRLTVVSFIYTSCQTICPATSQTFLKLQEKLASQDKSVHLVSISIDPENDTLPKLLQYAEKYHANKNWNFYTGSAEASITLQKRFGVYQGDKMNHAPVYFIQGASLDKWTRIDGLVTADFLLSTIRQISERNDDKK